MIGLLRTLVGAQVVSAQVGRVRREARRTVTRLVLGIVTGVLVLVAAGFLTAAGHLTLTRVLGPVSASLIVAGAYLVIALAVWAIGAVATRTPPTEAETPDLAAAAQTALYGIGQGVSDAARKIDPQELATAGGRKLARAVGPLPLAGIAIVAGYLIARRLDR